jgi:hypothetical protein
MTRPVLLLAFLAIAAPALAQADADSLIASLQATEPCAVREGTVVAAINVSVWGAMPSPARMSK